MMKLKILRKKLKKFKKINKIKKKNKSSSRLILIL